ncbi:flavin reductase family protein [bacterium RCC_150]
MTQLVTELDVERSYRNLMGRYATGVAVIAATHGAEPIGMAVNSFTSVSLSPALLLFCPNRASSTWHRISEIGSFTVSLLAADQENVSRTFAGPATDRFAEVSWTESAWGHPVIRGSLGTIDCVIESVHPAGDHDVVIARATSWQPEGHEESPLVFFEGKYRSLA